ncbi:threonine synthase [Caedibacter taeniospiralis]|uniref:threonine synthase n=1 Tax=Caedibacter taeniospiralis TaxID=28907 RepID=UPI000C26E056|nr:threonine synthase [Caedibacter taeniospiralis]
MKFKSTRGKSEEVSLTYALQHGLAKDGGLYVPAKFPLFPWRSLDKNMGYADFATQLLEPFFRGGELEDKLHAICYESFSFDLPIVDLDQRSSLLELFHGPTLSFKDFGARFLANALSHIKTDNKLTIMVATSGDTGSAVAAAFHSKSNINVMVLFPKGKISLRQQQQITCWQDNVCAVAVDGTFDDCQVLVKAAFADKWWQEHTHLNTSNSINIGRLLPQTTYYAYVSWQYFLNQCKKANFIVPSGNIGNVCACFWAKEMGLPIGEIIISQNENNVIGQFLQSAQLPHKPSVETLANAMDVGNPSNFERLYFLLGSTQRFKAEVTAFKASDEAIRRTILKVKQDHDLLICPHTATAVYAREFLPSDQHYIIVATAHPAKFEQVIEPIVGEKIPVPQSLQTLLNQQQSNVGIAPTVGAITELYQAYFNLSST